MTVNLANRLLLISSSLSRRLTLSIKECFQNTSMFFKYREMLSYRPDEALQRRISKGLLDDLQKFARSPSVHEYIAVNKSYFSTCLIPQDLTDRIINELGLEMFRQPDIKIYGTYFKSSYSDKDYSSKLFHRDFASVRMIKAFIYLNDVQDDSDGPLMLIRKPVGWVDDFYPVTIHKPKAWEDKQIQKNGLYKFFGKAGEVAILNTNRFFHLGSRLSEGKTRDAIIVNIQHEKSLVKNKFVDKL